jgi:hypothetical protein
MKLKVGKEWFACYEMAMTSEMDPRVVLEARKERLSVGFVADQDVYEVSKGLNATKLLPDLR